jgi:hypothetical protein
LEGVLLKNYSIRALIHKKGANNNKSLFLIN